VAAGWDSPPYLQMSVGRDVPSRRWSFLLGLCVVIRCYMQAHGHF